MLLVVVVVLYLVTFHHCLLVLIKLQLTYHVTAQWYSVCDLGPDMDLLTPDLPPAHLPC